MLAPEGVKNRRPTHIKAVRMQKATLDCIVVYSILAVTVITEWIIRLCR